MCEKYLDDRVNISENIKKMTKNELDREIEKIENDLKKSKSYKLNA